MEKENLSKECDRCKWLSIKYSTSIAVSRSPFYRSLHQPVEAAAANNVSPLSARTRISCRRARDTNIFRFPFFSHSVSICCLFVLHYFRRHWSCCTVCARRLRASVVWKVCIYYLWHGVRRIIRHAANGYAKCRGWSWIWKAIWADNNYSINM